jgi:hypothetical protein
MKANTEILKEAQKIQAKTVKGNDIEITVGNLGMIGNGWGMMLSVYMFVEFEGEMYRITPYFDYYAFEKENKPYCVLTLQEAHRVEAEYLKLAGYRETYFGGTVKL